MLLVKLRSYLKQMTLKLATINIDVFEKINQDAYL